MAIYKLEVMYRDASNYKTHFEVNVNSEEHPDVVYLKEEDEFSMGMFGTPSKHAFFDSDIHPSPYDDEEDHCIFEVENVTLLTT